MTFVLRGWSNSKDDKKAPKVIFRKEDMSVEFDEFVEAKKKVYRSINAAKIADVAKFGNKNRFEIFASPDESLGLRFIPPHPSHPRPLANGHVKRHRPSYHPPDSLGFGCRLGPFQDPTAMSIATLASSPSSVTIPRTANASRGC